MIYEQVALTLEGIPLVVAAVALHVLGVRARKSSQPAQEKGIVVGLLASALLVGDGWLSSGFTFSEFLTQDFFRLLLMSIGLVGASSFVVKWGAWFHRNRIAIPNQERAAQSQRDDNRKKSQEEQRAQQQLAEQRRAEWEAGAPERERLAKEQAEQAALAEARVKLEAERRVEARRKLLLCYHQNSPDVQDSISWERYQEYVANYLSDNLSPDAVEDNAERMIQTIEGLFEPEQQPQQSRSLQEIRDEYEEQRREILNLKYDQATTEAMLADLNFREDQAIMGQVR